MLTLLFSLIATSFAQNVVLRSPDVNPSFFEEQAAKLQARSFADVTAERLLQNSSQTFAMDQCLEALADNDRKKESICFGVVQVMKNELWTAPLRRVLLPFFDRLAQETQTHRKLYMALKQSLEQKFTFGKMNGASDLALRDQKLFITWLSAQPEWRDARFFINGIDLSDALLTDDKLIAQWFVISNAGRTMSFIGTLRNFQKFLQQADDFRFLNCQSVTKSMFDLQNLDAVTYIYSTDCIVPLKKPTAKDERSVYQRWQQSQATDLKDMGDMRSQYQLEKPSTLPKWVVPVALGLVIGAVALKGKKVLIRAPEF